MNNQDIALLQMIPAEKTVSVDLRCGSVTGAPCVPDFESNPYITTKHNANDR